MSSDRPQVGTPKGARYEMLDVWRGVVCLIVVLEHAGVVLWQSSTEGQGWEFGLRRALVNCLSMDLGSPFFFVMSGYCIASSLDSAGRRGTSPVEFLARRLWRIFPTYWAALFGFVALVAGLDAFGLTRLHRSGLALEVVAPGDLSLGQWLGNLTLTETWRPLLGGSYSSVYTRVAWSLCYQEQFYAVCVLALWLAPRRLAKALALATAAIVAYRVFKWDSGATHMIAGTFPLYWHVFAVGLAVYWRLNHSGRQSGRFGVELALAALVVIGLGSGSIPTWSSAGFGLVLTGLYRWDRQAGSIRWLAPVRACGRRSFSIYLTHLPVTMIGNTLLTDMGLTHFWAQVAVILPVVAVVSLGVGWVFHETVERRFMGTRPFASAGLALGNSLRVHPA